METVRMRIISPLASVVLAMLGASPVFANSQAFEDNKLHLKTCDGGDATVRWNGDSFAIAVFGKTTGRDHAAFKFLGWNGACHTATWDAAQGAFVVETAGATQPSQHVRYVAEDDSKWIGMRVGDGFFVTRVAAPGEDASDARLAEVAAWLKRTSAEFTPGVALAKQLAP